MSILGSLAHMVGCVALLLWGTHMVGSGVMRVFGSDLRQRVAQAMSRPVQAFFTGIAVTLGLQSSTAVGMMASSFVARGVLGAEPGYILMLGANVGTALVAQILSFPLSALAPLLMIAGWSLFRGSSSVRRKNLGRIGLGLGMMLFGLHEMLDLSGSVLGAHSWSGLGSLMTQQPALVLFAAMAVAWIFHSSVAVVLLILSLAIAGVLPLSAGWFAILGANLGGAIPPVVEAASIAERRLPLGNLIVRMVGVGLGVGASSLVIMLLEWRATPHDLVWAHLFFNIILAMIAFPFAKTVTKLVFNLAPDPPTPQDPGVPVHLDMVDKVLALSSAEREVLRVADLLMEVLKNSAKAVVEGDHDAAARIAQMSDATTSLGAAIRRFLREDDNRFTTPHDVQRASEILIFVVNMEHAVDIAEHQLVSPALRRHRELGGFNEGQQKALLDLMKDLERALNLAVAVFLNRDLDAARELVKSKLKSRRHENEWVSSRPQLGRWNQDMDADLRAMREARRIYGHLAAIGYEILEQSGQLRSRVKDA